MRKIIAVASKKGGTGKTTTAMSLGAALARKERRVLLIDTDQQGDLSRYLGFDGSGATIADLLLQTAMGKPCEDVGSFIRSSKSEGLEYIPSNVLLANTEMQLVNAIGRETTLRRVLQQEAFLGYDYILIDCPPSLGVITINAFAAADSVIVPVELEKFSFDGLGALLEILQVVRQAINPSLLLEGIVRTKHDRSKMSEAINAALLQEYGAIVFNAIISRAKEATNSSYRQQSLVSYKNKLGEQYMQLADELLMREVTV